MSQILRWKLEKTFDEMALADPRQKLTWRELDGALNRSINAVHSLSKSLRFGVFAPNSVETVMAYVSGFGAGVSSIPINFHLTAEEVAYQLENSGADILFVGPETLEVGLAAAKMTGVKNVVAWRCPATDGVIAWEEWLAEASDAEPPTHMAPRAHLHYTSGTTGTPKATETPPQMFPPVETVEELFYAFFIGAAAMFPGPGLTVGPMYHTGPLSSVRTLAGGQPLVLMDRFDAEAVLQTIEQFGIVRSLMVPTHFKRLLALPDDVRQKYDVSSLMMVNHTGSACPVEVKRQMIEWWGPVFLEAYGGTEIGSVSMIDSLNWLMKPGSVGRPMPGFEVIVVGDGGKALGPNQEGALYFRDLSGRGIIYVGDEEKTRDVHLEPGVCTIGEVGYVDDDGFIFITDRSSDMIISGGVNIYPAETENILCAHPGVLDAVVIGAPNEEMGEEVLAIIVAKDVSAPPTSEELDAFCRERIAGYKCPRVYDFKEEMGRTELGKINKRELRKEYWPTERTIGG